MLPDLPKKRKTLEADITPKVIEWFKKNYVYSVALEIKVGKNKLLPHQETALKEVQSGSFAHKLRDTGLNPFDCFVLKDARAFVVRCDVESKQCKATRIDKREEFYLEI